MKKTVKILIITVAVFSYFFVTYDYAYAEPVVGCTCSATLAVMAEEDKKCLDAGTCKQINKVCEMSVKAKKSDGTWTNTFIYNLSLGDSFGPAVFISEFLDAEKNPDDPTEWKGDHYFVEKEGTKCYTIPESLAANPNPEVTLQKIEYWNIDMRQTEGNLPCFGTSLDGKKYDGYAAKLQNGYAMVRISCSAGPPVEEDPDSSGSGDGKDSGSGGGDKLGISRLNKLGRGSGGGGRLALSTLIGTIIKAALSILGTIALIMFMYGGFVYMTSGGSAEDTKKAWNILIWGALGVIVILASYALASLIFGALV